MAALVGFRSSSPFVSDLGQDSGAKNPPDFLLRVRRGQAYGFPQCNWTKAKACKGFAHRGWLHVGELTGQVFRIKP